jgi:hypothetical protein
MPLEDDVSLVCPNCGQVTANFRLCNSSREPMLCTKCLMPPDPVHPPDPENRPRPVGARGDARWYKKWGSSGES